MRQTIVGAEPAGQLGLGVEAGHHRDLHVGVQRAQDGDAPQLPSDPAPYTRTLRPGGGGWRVIACSDTANGSAKTASSSVIESGTANSIESWAGHQLGVPAGGVGRHPGVDPGGDVAVGEVPAQAVVAGLAGRAQRRRCRGGRTTARVEHDPLPHLEPRASGPSSTTSATTSWPITWGNEQNPPMALSVSPSPKSRRICLESEPQMPTRRGRATTQSGAGSGGHPPMSISADGVCARFCIRGLAPSGTSRTRLACRRPVPSSFLRVASHVGVHLLDVGVDVVVLPRPRRSLRSGR